MKGRSGDVTSRARVSPCRSFAVHDTAVAGMSSRNRSRETRAIQRDLGISHTQALRIWEERNPERAERIAEGRAAARDDARARQPQIDVAGYLSQVQGLPLTELDLDSPPQLADAFVVSATPVDATVDAKLVRLTNEGIAKWRFSADVWATIAGRKVTPPESRNVPPSPPPIRARLVRLRARRATVTFEFDVRRGSTVRRMHTTLEWTR